MSGPRVFRVADHLQLADGEPVRSAVHETAEAAVVAWIVKPEQRISAHVLVIASAGEVHGVLNTGTEALVFVALVGPALAGFELL